MGEGGNGGGGGGSAVRVWPDVDVLSLWSSRTNCSASFNKPKTISYNDFDVVSPTTWAR